MKLTIWVFVLFFVSCTSRDANPQNEIIAKGQMPAIIVDDQSNLHVTYGMGDSLMYSTSIDNGKTFTTPSLVSVISKLAASHTRGPQIGVTSTGLVLTACDAVGNISSFVKSGSREWKQSARVNDMDTVAKENLMSLSSYDNFVYAVWLDLRDKHNKIFGSKSIDGGNSWSKNKMIYASRDSTVCECCKPSVLVKGNNVYVMFRNWLDGNRDMYLIQSTDGGESFGNAEKLGQGNWPLKGCPMDGGAIAINTQNVVQTVWNRKGSIYAAMPGNPEKEIGRGRSCSMESVDGKNVYTWVEDGEVIVLKPTGEKTRLGKGQLPILKSLNNKHVICLWEKDKEIYKAIIQL